LAGLLLYYITDRSQFPGDERARREQLLDRVAAAAESGLDFIQLREKDLPAAALEELARTAVARLQRRWRAQLFVNARIDVAIAAGAHGVHLPADDISVTAARRIFAVAGMPDALVASSCHTVEEVRVARQEGADFVVFGPVFEKSGAKVNGLKRLREACVAAGNMPVLALGGVTAANATDCLRAGAKGVAGIRIFQEGGLDDTVRRLRG
jgi:thiamine-phosphate pyrophosphorylase